MLRQYDDFGDIDFDDNDVVNRIILEQTLEERRLAGHRRRIPLKRQWDWSVADDGDELDLDDDLDDDLEDDFDDDDYGDDYGDPDNDF